MSTRANIIIHGDRTNAYPDNVFYEHYTKNRKHLRIKDTIILYSHYDGYIAGIGIDIIRHLMTYLENNKNRLNPKTIGNIEALNFFEQLPRFYKTTDNIHDDIEFLYILEFMPNRICFTLDRANSKLTLFECTYNDSLGSMEYTLSDSLMRIDDNITLTHKTIDFQECKQLTSLKLN
jgi:hypothetical protein